MTEPTRQRQYMFELQGRNEDGTIFFRHLSAANLQEAVRKYDGKGFLFKVVQHRRDAEGWANCG